MVPCHGELSNDDSIDAKIGETTPDGTLSLTSDVALDFFSGLMSAKLFLFVPIICNSEISEATAYFSNRSKVMGASLTSDGSIVINLTEEQRLLG